MTTAAKRATVAIVLVLAAGTATSGATYTASSTNAQGFTAAADFGVHVSLQSIDPALRGSVSIGATATETNGGTITNVAIEYSPAGAGSWTTICGDPGSPYSCPLDTTTLSNGQYDFRARATNDNGYTRTSAVVANRVIDNAAPSVALDDPGAWFRGTLTLSSAVSDSGGSGLASVRYERKLSSGGTWSTACTASASPYSCSFDTTSLTDATSYDFRAVATDGAGNVTTSPAIVGRKPDNAAPTGTLAAPGANLRGTVSLTGTASDTHSGVASARMEYSVAGADSWSTACVDTTSPFSSCDWNTTTVTDGLYDVRTVVTDVAGNTFASAASTGRRVDNVLPTVSLDAPPSPIAGTVTFNSTADDTGGSGVASVTTQYSTAGSGSWANACAPDTLSPYSCTANSAGVADGLYDFRAVATDVAGNVAASTVLTRRVDNVVPSGADVQTADGGGTPGVIQTGDSITLTYSEEMDPASIVAGWNGSGSQSIYVRFTHHNQGDRALFYNSANTALIPLAASPGAMFDQDYVPGGGATFTATLTTTGSSFTIVLGTKTAGNVNGTAPPAAATVWSPSNGARDLANRACSTTNRTETGAADVEF